MPYLTAPPINNTNASPQQQQHPPPRLSLLGLPRELRDQILLHTTTCPTEIKVAWDFRLDKTYRANGPAYQPAISCVNRQLRSESLANFYKYNTFAMHTLTELEFGLAKSWITTIGEENSRNVRRIVLCGPMHRGRGSGLPWNPTQVRLEMDLERKTIDIRMGNSFCSLSSAEAAKVARRRDAEEVVRREWREYAEGKEWGGRMETAEKVRGLIEELARVLKDTHRVWAG